MQGLHDGTVFHPPPPTMTDPVVPATNLDLATLVDDLFRLLRLRTTPIAMKLFVTVEAMAAVPRFRRP